MSRIRWTTSALNDLKIISLYIEGHRNLVTANRVCRIIYDAVQILRRFPESSKPGMEEGTRELVVPALPSYIVVYRLLPSAAVQILRIWHAAQQRQELAPVTTGTANPKVPTPAPAITGVRTAMTLEITAHSLPSPPIYRAYALCLSR